MARVAHLYRINPEADISVKHVLTMPKKETVYDGSNDKSLSIYAKEIRERK